METNLATAAIITLSSLLVALGFRHNQLYSSLTLLRDSHSKLNAKAQAEETKLEFLSNQLEQNREQKRVLQENLERVTHSLQEERKTKAILDNNLKNARESAKEKLEMLANARTELSDQFKVVASELLDEKSKKFTEQNQTNLKHIVAPLKEQLEKFDKRIVDSRTEDAKERQQVRSELEQIRSLGLVLNENASNLTNALKGDVQAQGAWGEMILESILEKSGLIEGREYELQGKHYTDEGKRVRPDAIIRLPGNKAMIVDSKVSLSAFERSVNAKAKQEKAKAEEEHVQSVRSHIQNLSKKEYQNVLEGASLDFVFMFIANDHALMNALKRSPSLFDEAMEKNIGLVCPSLLMVSLRTVENIWRTDRQNQNAMAIAKQAGSLYDKFVGFVSDLDAIGLKLNQTQRAFENSYGKLKTGNGNLINKVEKIRSLGARTSKSLPKGLTGETTERDS